MELGHQDAAELGVKFRQPFAQNGRVCGDFAPFQFSLLQVFPCGLPGN